MLSFLIRQALLLLLLSASTSAYTVIISGSDLQHQKLYAREQVKVLYKKHGKHEEAHAYVKKVTPTSVTIGKGIWRETIPYANITSVQVQRMPMKVGSRLKAIGNNTIIGRVMSIEAGNITVKTSAKKLQKLVLDDWQQIQIETRNGTRAAEGAVIGMVAGCGLGAYYGGSGLEETDPWDLSGIEKLAASMLAGAVGGMITGAIVGKQMHKSLWRTALLTPPKQSHNSSERYQITFIFKLPARNSSVKKVASTVLRAMVGLD